MGGKCSALWNGGHAKVPANAAKVQIAAGQQEGDGVTEQPEIKNFAHSLFVIKDLRLRDKNPIKTVGRAEHRGTHTGDSEDSELFIAVVDVVQDKNPRNSETSGSLKHVLPVEIVQTQKDRISPNWSQRNPRQTQNQSYQCPSSQCQNRPVDQQLLRGARGY